jgi:ParB-like chromosome segregation protein Spo0J
VSRAPRPSEFAEAAGATAGSGAAASGRAADAVVAPARPYALSASSVRVPVDALILEGSPRLEGENVAHTRVLAEVPDRLPPIFVHRPTMQVIDGVHRVQAARRRGETMIDVIFFEGDLDDAFVHAVRANITHGLPLSMADRQAAAERIIASHPQWSDRAVAVSVGLAPATIGGIRARVTGGGRRATERLGQDGRVRPLDVSDGRRRAAAVIAERPQASLREVAREAGVSVGTAHDVRKRINSGKDPVPAGSGRRRRRITAPDGGDRSTGAGATAVRHAYGGRSPSAILAGLRQDPSVRYSERGREIIRRLSACLVEVDEWQQVADDLPEHCAHPLYELARAYADRWLRISKQLQARLSVESPGADKQVRYTANRSGERQAGSGEQVDRVQTNG